MMCILDDLIIITIVALFIEMRGHMYKDWDTLENASPPPPFALMVSPAQTVRDRGLKIFMDVHLGITTGVIQVIFEFPPLSRDIGDFHIFRQHP